MTDTVIFGRVENVKAFPSTGNTRIEITVPVEAYPSVVSMLFGQDVLLSLPSREVRDALRIYGVHTVGEDGSSRGSDEQPAKVGCGPLCKWAGMVCKLEADGRRDRRICGRDGVQYAT